MLNQQSEPYEGEYSGTMTSVLHSDVVIDLQGSGHTTGAQQLPSLRALFRAIRLVVLVAFTRHLSRC